MRHDGEAHGGELGFLVAREIVGARVRSGRPLHAAESLELCVLERAIAVPLFETCWPPASGQRPICEDRHGNAIGIKECVVDEELELGGLALEGVETGECVF